MQRSHPRAEQRLEVPPGGAAGAEGPGRYCGVSVLPLASSCVPLPCFGGESPWLSPNSKLPSGAAGTRGRRDRPRMELYPQVKPNRLRDSPLESSSASHQAHDLGHITHLLRPQLSYL